MQQPSTAGDYITIVSGLPRSGTSMMMQMVAAGGLVPLTDEVREADDDNPRGYYEFEPVKKLKQDASWVDDAGGKVVKMVYRLLYDLPPHRSYRVIFMNRDLDEVIASQEVMLARQGKSVGGMEPARLREVYRKQLQDAMDWLAAQPNFAVLYVDYQDAVRDPERVIQALNGFLDGSLDVDAMRRVPDRSLHRQRRTGG
jgi:Sulfotransferase domain